MSEDDYDEKGQKACRMHFEDAPPSSSDEPGSLYKESKVLLDAFIYHYVRAGSTMQSLTWHPVIKPFCDYNIGSLFLDQDVVSPMSS